MKSTVNDHRTRVTRMLVRRAFTTLLAQKPIQSISIKELCALAGINRSTFYAHYTDLYDLLHQIEAEMFSDLRTALEPLLSSASPATFRDVTTGIFQCLKDNAEVCVMALGEYGDKDFIVQLMSLGRGCCLTSYARYFRSASPKDLEYFYAFASNGCIGLLRQWLAEGMVTTASEMAAIADRLMMGGVRALSSEG